MIVKVLVIPLVAIPSVISVLFLNHLISGDGLPLATHSSVSKLPSEITVSFKGVESKRKGAKIREYTEEIF